MNSEIQSQIFNMKKIYKAFLDFKTIMSDKKIKSNCEKPHKVFINLNLKYIKKNKLNIICGMPFCEATKDAREILEKNGIDFECAYGKMNHEIIHDVEKKYSHYTLPIIFLNGKFVGGLSELASRKLESEQEVGGNEKIDKLKEKALNVKDKTKDTFKTMKDKISSKDEKLKEKGKDEVKEK